MAADGFNQSAAAVKAELKKLEGDLQRADARGDRRGALNILSRMLELQRRFMERWQSGARTPPPPAAPARAAGSDDDDSGVEGVNPPGHSGSNPGNV